MKAMLNSDPEHEIHESGMRVSPWLLAVFPAGLAIWIGIFILGRWLFRLVFG